MNRGIRGYDRDNEGTIRVSEESRNPPSDMGIESAIEGNQIRGLFRVDRILVRS
jgi:hypothetical protein